MRLSRVLENNAAMSSTGADSASVAKSARGTERLKSMMNKFLVEEVYCCGSKGLEGRMTERFGIVFVWLVNENSLRRTGFVLSTA